jgi:hypothetical protein
MRAILEFNLPEDNEEFLNACSGWKYHSIIFDIVEYFRVKLKHGDLKDGEVGVVEKIQSDILEIVGSSLEDY